MSLPIPPSASAALRDRGISCEQLELQVRPGPPRPVQSLVGAGVVLTLATSSAGCRLIELELHGREWGRSVGVAAPAVLASASTWMLAEWNVVAAPAGIEYVEAATDAADQIMLGEPPRTSVPATQWSGNRHHRLRRSVRVIVGGVPILTWLQAKRAVSTLTDWKPAHGDYYFRNVLNVRGSVSVVDWEFMGNAPAFTDHLRFWSALKHPEDRTAVLSRVMDAADPQRWFHVCVLARWLGLRLLSENLSAPPSQRDSDDLLHARIVAREAVALGALADRPGSDLTRLGVQQLP